MTSLKSLLQQYSDGAHAISVQLGADETLSDAQRHVAARGQDINRKTLRKDLQRVKQDNNRYFVVCAAMVVLLFVVSVGLVIVNLQNAAVVKIALSAFGVSAAGLITVMTNLWRVKSNTELLMILAINTDGETLKTVVNILAKAL
jgi:hypothetical protein